MDATRAYTAAARLHVGAPCPECGHGLTSHTYLDIPKTQHVRATAAVCTTCAGAGAVCAYASRRCTQCGHAFASHYDRSVPRDSGPRDCGFGLGDVCGCTGFVP